MKLASKNWVQEAVSKESKYSEGLNSEIILLKIFTMDYSKCCVKQTLHKWHVYIHEILINGPIRKVSYLLKFIDREILKKLTSGQTVRNKPYSNIRCEAVNHDDTHCACSWKSHHKQELNFQEALIEKPFFYHSVSNVNLHSYKCSRWMFLICCRVSGQIRLDQICTSFSSPIFHLVVKLILCE